MYPNPQSSPTHCSHLTKTSARSFPRMKSSANTSMPLRTQQNPARNSLPSPSPMPLRTKHITNRHRPHKDKLLLPRGLDPPLRLLPTTDPANPNHLTQVGSSAPAWATLVYPPAHSTETQTNLPITTANASKRTRANLKPPSHWFTEHGPKVPNPYFPSLSPATSQFTSSALTALYS